MKPKWIEEFKKWFLENENQFVELWTINELSSAKELIKDFIQQTLDTQRQSLIDELEKEVDKVFNFGTLPEPNKYGKWVSVKNHNKVVAQMKSGLQKAIDIIKKGK